jgi:hypothetical protein
MAKRLISSEIGFRSGGNRFRNLLKGFEPMRAKGTGDKIAGAPKRQYVAQTLLVTRVDQAGFGKALRNGSTVFSGQAG